MDQDNEQREDKITANGDYRVFIILIALIMFFTLFLKDIDREIIKKKHSVTE